jgi:hypothetical protein
VVLCVVRLSCIAGDLGVVVDFMRKLGVVGAEHSCVGVFDVCHCEVGQQLGTAASRSCTRFLSGKNARSCDRGVISVPSLRPARGTEPRTDADAIYGIFSVPERAPLPEGCTQKIGVVPSAHREDRETRSSGTGELFRLGQLLESKDSKPMSGLIQG